MRKGRSRPFEVKPRGARLATARFFFRESEGLGDDLFGSPRACVGRTIIKDSEKKIAAANGGHELPAFEGARIAGESKLDGGREFAFGFHRGEDLLSNLFAASCARGWILGTVDQVGEPFADGVAEAVKPAPEGAVFREMALEFGRDDDGALGSVGLNGKFGG